MALAAGEYRGRIGSREYGTHINGPYAHNTGGSMTGRRARYAAMHGLMGAQGMHMGGASLGMLANCAPCAQGHAGMRGIGDLEVYTQTYKHHQKPVQVNLGRPRRASYLGATEVWSGTTPPPFLGSIERWSRTTAWPMYGAASEPLSAAGKVALGGLAGLALAALL